MIDKEQHRNNRLQARLDSGELVCLEDGRIVCPFCGGNCGQCGHTDLIGSPEPSLQQIVDNVYGEPKSKWGWIKMAGEALQWQDVVFMVIIIGFLYIISRIS